MVPTMWFAAGGVAVAILGMSIVTARRRRARRQALIDGWGVWRERRRDLERIAGYHRFKAAEPGAPPSLDDRTWQDLDLDEVFEALDHTTSSVGRQALYHRLRSLPDAADRQRVEAVANRVMDDPGARSDVLVALSRLESTSGYWLWRLAVPGAIPAERWFVLFPILAGLVLASAVAIPFWPQAVLLLIATQVINMASRQAITWRLAAILGPLRQIEPLLQAADDLLAVPGLAETGGHRLTEGSLAALRGLRRVAGWIGRDRPTQNDLAMLLLEYLNLVLLLDANALFFGGRQLARNREAFLRVIEGVGEIDLAASVASYRVGAGSWIRPEFRAPRRGWPSTACAIRCSRTPSRTRSTCRRGRGYC